MKVSVKYKAKTFFTIPSQCATILGRGFFYKAVSIPKEILQHLSEKDDFIIIKI